MNQLENLNCIALQYKWKLTAFNRHSAFLSNEIKFQNEASFRVGWNKKPVAYNQSSSLFLLATNLNKIGLRAISVTVSTRIPHSSPKIKEMKSTTIPNSGEEDSENGTIQLFTAINESVSGNGPSTPSFTFTIYLTSVVDVYRVRQVDGLLGEQLLSSATNSNGAADFKLIAGDGEILPVHKFILVARSPVFAILFSEKESIKSMDCTMFSVDEVKQFIRFIYTGEFQGPASSNLMALAVKCEVKTLENLCRAASEDITVEKMAELAMHLKPGYQENMKNVELTPESDFEIKNDKGNVSIFKFTWKIDDWTKKRDFCIPVSKALTYEGIELFRTKIDIYNTYRNASASYYQHAIDVRLFSYGPQKIGCIIDEVTFSVDRQCDRDQENNKNSTKFVKMIENQTQDRKLLQVFNLSQPVSTTCTDACTELSCPFFVNFQVKYSSAVDNFINMFLDSTWSEQLWAAAVNRKMTDVEFLVGEETFGAHRSLVSVRSPVFAAMFASGMKEAETGQVRIEDVHPTTFQLFLKFLYTGMIEPSAIDKELFTIADKYGVETLMELCRPATQPVHTEEAIKTFFFC